MAYYRVGDQVLDEQEYAEHNAAWGEWILAFLLTLSGGGVGKWLAPLTTLGEACIPIGFACGFAFSLLALGRFRSSLASIVVALTVLAAGAAAVIGLLQYLGN